ncbi:MAG: branched-chain alpha-keto acid dehydrogenase subunit E2 [Verrucomicrobia bacterium]|nr:MAG: branched-chain alpha-keto acid dehydrogenase subunit E2 [Verrucomicrobiota bacterium]
MDITVPVLGENITAADVTKVLVKAGDTVAVDQPLIELETGKATIEVPATAAGKVAQVLVKAGDKVGIGQVILTLEGAVKKEAGKRQKAESSEQRAAVSAPPPSVPHAAPRKTTAPPAPQIAQPAPTGPHVPVAAAPSVRQLARELGVDIHQVQGTDPGGRISEADVKAYAKKLITTAPVPVVAGAGLPQIALPDFAQWGAIAREPMSTVRRITAAHMAAAWLTIPHVTQHDRAEITELENLRKRFADRAEKLGTKLTMTAILLKVIAAALKVFPKFNASLDLAKQEIVFKKYIHLGVAVDTERGLLVPVIRDVDKKNIIQLAVELGQLAQKARAGKIPPADLVGGTFTVTNLGGIGGSFFTPIINAPEVAILGIGRAQMEPCIQKKDQICTPRLMLPLSLSYDHRLIDGADGARFLRWIVEAIEEPLLISLEG